LRLIVSGDCLGLVFSFHFLFSAVSLDESDSDARIFPLVLLLFFAAGAIGSVGLSTRRLAVKSSSISSTLGFVGAENLKYLCSPRFPYWCGVSYRQLDEVVIE
jgi:hypothetical protein